MFVLIFVNSSLVSIGFKFWMTEAAFALIGQAEICSFIVPSFFLKPLRDHAFGFTRILGSTERPGTISCSYPRMLAGSPMTAGRQRLEKGIIGITLVASAVKRRVIRSVQQFVVGKALRQVWIGQKESPEGNQI